MSEAPKHARHAAPSPDAPQAAPEADQTALAHESRELAHASHAVTPEVLPERPPLVQRLHDFAENRNPYTPAERLYTDRTSEEVSRLDGRRLNRPFVLPTPVKAVMGVVAAVALAAGGVFVYRTADGILNADERAQAALEESLSRDVTLDLPPLTTLVALDDAGILSTLQSAGMNVVDLADVLGTAEGLELVRLADGVDAADAATSAALWAGTGSMDAAEAVRLLNGSWMLTADRADGLNMNARYADFTSGSAEAALAAAVTAQGLDGTATSDVSQDASGNTIQTGQAVVGEVAYQWQVSVCPLDEVYAIGGLPDTAMYVGVRFTQA